MKMQRRLTRATMILATLLLALALAGCGDDKKDEQEVKAPGIQGKPVPVEISDNASATPLSTYKTKIGEVIVGQGDHTVYTYDRPVGQSLDCSGRCAWTWLPVITNKGVSISGDVAKGKVGAVEYSDKGDQVTYNGHPLFFFTGSTDPGDVSGNGATSVGVTWYTISPDGELNRKPVPKPSN
jgi:predicted lipoprotein with Yx(FWY)xxD motif